MTTPPAIPPLEGSTDNPYWFDFNPADGFSAETDLMQTTATSWLELGASLAKMAMDVATGLGHADDFGYIDLAPDIGSKFENYVTRLMQVLVDGGKTATEISANLSATAKAYDTTDQRAKDSMPGAGG